VSTSASDAGATPPCVAPLVVPLAEVALAEFGAPAWVLIGMAGGAAMRVVLEALHCLPTQPWGDSIRSV